MKILLLMTLIPLFAGFSVSAFGFGAMGSHGTAKQRATERRSRQESNRRFFNAQREQRQREQRAKEANRRAQQANLSAIAKEVEQWKSDYLRVKAENNHLEAQNSKLKVKLEEYYIKQNSKLKQNGKVGSQGNTCDEKLYRAEKACFGLVNRNISMCRGFTDWLVRNKRSHSEIVGTIKHKIPDEYKNRGEFLKDYNPQDYNPTTTFRASKSVR